MRDLFFEQLVGEGFDLRVYGNSLVGVGAASSPV